MKNYLCSFLEEFAYPEAACTVLLQGFDAITNDSSALEAFTAILDTYKADKLCDFKELIARMRELSARIGLQEYTGNLILLICMSETLKAYYKEELMAATLNSFLGNLDKIPIYINDCKKMNIQILSPSINKNEFCYHLQ